MVAFVRRSALYHSPGDVEREVALASSRDVMQKRGEGEESGTSPASFLLPGSRRTLSQFFDDGLGSH